MNLHLLIDDIRNLPGMDIIIRNPKYAAAALQNFSVTHLYLDNDLGEGLQEGWQILHQALEHGNAPKNIRLVTSNPVARKKMQLMLEAHGYVSRDKINYRKD